MELLLILLLFALLFGVGGVFTAAKWLFIIALFFLILGVFSGYHGGRRW